MNALKIVAGAALLVGLVAAPAHAQKGKFSDKAEIDRLRAEIARLRADLDAALKDIAALKAGLGGKAPTPEEGPFFQGRSAARWLEQLKDADPTFRADAVKAISALAQQKKDLAPVLLKLMKDDSDGIVRANAAQGGRSIGGRDGTEAHRNTERQAIDRGTAQRRQRVARFGTEGQTRRAGADRLAQGQ